MRDFDGDGRGVENFVGGDSGERAAGDVADYIAAGAFGREADGVERIDNFREGLDREPVKLDILAHGDVGKIAGIFARDAPMTRS